MLHKSVYVKGRKTLAEDSKSGAPLFLGNERIFFNYNEHTDICGKASAFLYFFGITKAELAAIVDFDKNKNNIFGNEMNHVDLVCLRKQQTPDDTTQSFGGELIFTAYQLDRYIKNAGDKDRAVHYLMTYRAVNKIKLLDLFIISFAHLIKQKSEFRSTCILAFFRP